jgi:uncharacterized protein
VRADAGSDPLTFERPPALASVASSSRAGITAQTGADIGSPSSSARHGHCRSVTVLFVDAHKVSTMAPIAALVVLAKEPVPGRVKTRLCPPCTPTEAAAIAKASLTDTLATVAAVPARRRLLALDGAAGHWVPDGFEVVPQADGGLADRLADVFERAGGPAFVIGMDTPQLTPALLARGAAQLRAADAALGLASDGGYWGIGLGEPDPAAFVGVPMGTPRTGAAQRERLRALGLHVRDLPTLRDVDTYEDALAVVPLVARQSAFARTMIRPTGLEGVVVAGAARGFAQPAAARRR